MGWLRGLLQGGPSWRLDGGEAGLKVLQVPRERRRGQARRRKYSRAVLSTALDRPGKLGWSRGPEPRSPLLSSKSSADEDRKEFKEPSRITQSPNSHTKEHPSTFKPSASLSSSRHINENPEKSRSSAKPNNRTGIRTQETRPWAERHFLSSCSSVDNGLGSLRAGDLPAQEARGRVAGSLSCHRAEKSAFV